MRIETKGIEINTRQRLDAYSTACQSQDWDLSNRLVREIIGSSTVHSGELLGLSEAIVANNRVTPTLEAVQHAVELAPNLPYFYYNLAIAFRQLSRFTEAAQSLRAAIDLAPQTVNLYWHLADVLKAAGQTKEAVSVVQRGVNIVPSADAYLKLAISSAEDRQLDESEKSLRKAIELDPNHVKALEGLGLRLQQLGRFDEAVVLFRRAIEIQPDRPGPYLWLLQDRKVVEEDRPLVARLEEMLMEPKRSPIQRSQLSYALGKSHEDLGHFGKAMGHFDEANRLSAEIRLQGNRYSPEEQRAATNQRIKAFSEEFINHDYNIAQAERRPIFIVGMMRSGTTLVEQILSCHPEIAAGGEVFFWMRPEIIQATSGLCERRIDAALLSKVGESYSKLLAEVGDGEARVTDKMPLNYEMLGPIRMLFPHARVIHCRRNPVDTCLSLYKTPLHGASFLFNKANIVFAYKEYLRLMAHWRNALPTDFFFEIDYEGLVANREQAIREMLGFLDLKWTETCLHHEKNPREVSTPSRWQARQPIYSTSVGRWRNYEPWLGEFRELL